MQDEMYMARALKLAARGRFTTHPNPNVGCVIVKDGEIVGEGFHYRAGEPHAEVHALRMAGEKARGATAYVTLEPCSHHGRTPPCCDALIAAGVSRVVAAMQDPNPQVAGRGLYRLQQSGIEVSHGLMMNEAEALNKGFLKRMRTGFPWVQLKLGASLDGRTAMASGESQWIMFSDCHRGVGTSNDNFLKNQHLYFAALQHYYQNNFTYIELGDGDELWENRSFDRILEIHSNVFWLLSQFYYQKRLYLLYGNHDIVKQNSSFATLKCKAYYCDATQCYLPLFPGITFQSGIILWDKNHKKDIYLTHGHQADFFNSTLWKTARFLVRYVWGPLEQIGFSNPTSAARNHTRKQKIEERLTRWAKNENHILITGHTHRPMLGTKDSPYFNTGSCVHPRCITCIEIEHRCLTLVKWCLDIHEDMSLYVSREELAGPICVDEY